MAENELVRVEREDGGVAVVVIDNPPVNALSRGVRSGLLEAVRRLGADEETRALVLIGAGSTYIAGADVREFSLPPQEPHLPDVIAALEQCRLPVVSAIHGAALGGGYEVALGSDVRVALSDAVVGLPEVTLGIIPGAGGTQRLPRLVGVPTAIDLISSGRHVPAREALELGMVDDVVDGGAEDLRRRAVELARSSPAKNPVSARAVPECSPDDLTAATERAGRNRRSRKAAAAAAEVVALATSAPIKEALATERTVFSELKQSPEAAALRHQFFSERQARRLPPDGHPRDVSRVAVIGGGTMGAGITAALLQSGVPVVLVEQDQKALDAATRRVHEHGADVVLLEGAVGIEQLGDVDLVVEAVFEDREVKRELLRDLSAALPGHVILASNTSYLDIDDLAEVVDDPTRVVGLHFFAPATRMRLVEVVRGRHTSPDTLATAMGLAKRLGKVPVVAGVCEGFIGNRIYAAYRLQCELMVEEGAWPQDVDAAMRDLGLAMGPFAVGDLSGLDIAWATRQRLRRAGTFRTDAPLVLDRLHDLGRLGRKTGAGWYRYPAEGGRGEPDPVVDEIITEVSARRGLTRRPFTADEIHRRVLGAIVNESAHIVAEGIAERAADVDVVLVNGYGFPASGGGPAFWVSRDPDGMEAAVDELARVTGAGFQRGDLSALVDPTLRPPTSQTA